MKNSRINTLVGIAVDAPKQVLEEAALLEDIAREIMQESRIKPDDESYRMTKKSVEVFLSEIINSSCQELRKKKP